MCKRCQWANNKNELYLKYHDEEWGVPLHDDIRLFEMISLEGAQAGLSWETILKRRENYRIAFDGFDPRKVVKYDKRKIDRLLNNEGIIRNKLKIGSVVKNARVFIDIQKEYGSFDAFIWKYVDDKQIKNCYKTIKEIPPKTPLSDRISKDLKKRGMSFVGSTIIYAFMQSIGMVNDHTVDCFRYDEVGSRNGASPAKADTSTWLRRC